MNVVSFELSSPFGILKKGESRSSNFNTTYTHLHKIVVKGVLGSIIGLEGYNTHYLKKKLGLTDKEFPDFYEETRELEIAIAPITNTGDFSKQIDTFTEAQGFFGDKGSTLLVKDQVLLKPKWKVYVNLDTLKEEVADRLKDYLLNSKTEYIPYIGKNENPAIIENAKEEKLKHLKGEVQLSSLFKEGQLEVVDEDEADYFYTELLPSSLNESTGRYILKKHMFTDSILEGEYYQTEEKENIVFI